MTRLQAASPPSARGGPATTSTGSPRPSAGSSTRQVGSLVLEHHQLTPADAPGLQLVVYTAAEAGSAARLAELAA